MYNIKTLLQHIVFTKLNIYNILIIYSHVLIRYIYYADSILFHVLFQGPQGLANFSECSYTNHSSEAVASDRFPSYSIWLPTEVDLDVCIITAPL